MYRAIASAAVHAAEPSIEYTFKMWRMAFENACATAACAQGLMTAKSPEAFSQLWSAQVQRHLDAMTAQGRAFGELAGRLTAETGEPSAILTMYSKGLASDDELLAKSAFAPVQSPSQGEQHHTADKLQGGATASPTLSPSDEVLLLHVME